MQLKDDVFSMPLPGSDLVFTKHLFIKDEVNAALLISILDKNTEKAIYWALELLSSGFKNHLFNILWKIYYDFYYTINPFFEQYFLTKTEQFFHSQSFFLVSSIIINMLKLPFTLDIFLLRILCNDLDISHEITTYNNDYSLEWNMTQWMDKKDVRSIAFWITTFFQPNKTSKTNNMFIDEKHLYLAKTISKLLEPQSKKHMIYVVASETKSEIHVRKPYNILKKCCQFGTNDCQQLSLFELTRYKYPNFKNKWLENWEYHASFSPIWLERIRNFGGYQNIIEQKIIFPEDSEFYDDFGLEPDEQPLDIQNKCIPNIEKNTFTWKMFYKKYYQNTIYSLVEICEEELEAFNLLQYP
jgi:hypothetical protein